MFKDIPKNWTELKFDSFFNVLSSKKFQVQKQDYIEDGKIPIVDQGQNKIAGYTNDESKIFNETEVIIFGDHTRTIKYIDFKFAVGADGTQILTTKKEINIKFAYYQLLTKNIPDTGYNRHFKYVKAEKYYLPPTIEEQEEIVKILDTASDMVRLRQECINHTNNLIPAIFQEMFGNVLEKAGKDNIGQYYEVGTGGTPRREISEYYVGNNPWVKTTEVNNCYIYDTEEKISDVAIKNTNCSLYPKGTILMAMYGQGKTRGKVAYLKIAATTNQACAALQLKNNQLDKINNIYVFYYLQYIYDYLRTLSQGGGRPNMNLSIVRNIPLFVPPKNLQEEFAQKVQEIEEYKQQQYEELEKAKQMFNSLLHHAFTGELTRRAYEKS